MSSGKTLFDDESEGHTACDDHAIGVMGSDMCRESGSVATTRI